MDVSLYFSIVTSLILVSFLGAICALFSYFLDYCFWENSIFSRWLPFIAEILVKKKKPKVFEGIQAGRSWEDTPKYEDLIIQAALSIPAYKLLGGCAVCMNMWIALISFIPLNILLSLSYWYILPYALFSSFVLRKLMKV